MAIPWQNKLKEAERALNVGEVDAARRLLADSQVRRSPAGQELTERVVQNIAQRAERNVSLGNSTAGWRDLANARALVGDAAEVIAAREKMINFALSDVEKLLQDSDPDAALAKLNRLHEHSIAGGRVATMRQVVLKARRAERLAQFGKFEDAAREWKSAKELRSDLNVLNEREAKCLNVAPKEGQLARQLQQALSDRAWTDALDLASELLNIAPQHPMAREAREEAWKRVGENLTDSERLRRTAPWRFANPARANRSVKPELPEGSIVTGPGKCENRRLQLWVDAVGGYLVCLADEVEIGQASHGTKVDIPVFGNLSHVHARIRRDGEGYILSPEGKVRVSGRELIGPSFLSDGDEIQLGEVVRYRFRRPHALSASARLEPLSGHRTQPPSDMILLMAESCVLGPRLNNHVVCRDWTDDVILFRLDGAIHCRTSKEMEIDGRLCDGEGQLAANSHIRGEDFSLSVEEI